MLNLKRNKRGVAIVLLFALLVPGWAAANQNYNFTNIDIPLTPIYDNSEDNRYTEELWNVAEDGIFDESGSKVSDLENYPTVEPNFSNPPKIPEKPDSFEDYKQSLINNWGGKKSFAEKRLSGVKENLNDQKKRFDSLEEQISEIEGELEPVREQVTQLQGQVDLINSQVRFTKSKIVNVEVMIAEKQIEIKEALLFLQRSEIELEIQKKIVLDYVKLLYQEESKFFDLYDDSSSAVKLLLADESVSENLLGAEYFSIMEKTGRQVFHDLNRSRLALVERQDEIASEQEELSFLYEKLNDEKRTLEESKFSKKQLLETTQGKEEEYTLLLERALQDQIEAAISVQNLQDNIQLIESKLNILDDGLDEVVEAGTVDDLEMTKESIEMMDSIDGQGQEFGETTSGKAFIWPIPANKITTEFQDPHYPKKWGVHNAIDVRAKQFTEVIAPANAYVFQVKDGGMGYSYIVLAHKNKLVTVYGHLSEILVTPGTTVRKGDVIGLTGGTPGAKGSGLQTTGPHLHFETYYKGEPVDPLKYLPISEIPLEYVPDKYLWELE